MNPPVGGGTAGAPPDDLGGPIRVVIVDDQELVRAGISMMLSIHPDIEVVAEATDGAGAVATVLAERPDVVLMDVRMPGMDGVEATRRLTAEQADDPDHLTKVLVLTTFADDDALYSALRAGASGYLLKHAAPTDLAAAVRRVAGGDAWIDPVVAPRVITILRELSTGSPSQERAIEALTEREREVLVLIARGRTNTEIGRDLVISEATVKTHVSRILMKSGSRDRAAAVALAYESGLVVPGQA